MKSPHSHYPKGKRVWIRLRDGSEVVGKFIQRRRDYVVLDSGRIDMRAIAAMGYNHGRASVMTQ